MLRAKWRRLGIGGLTLVLLALMVPAFADAPESGSDPGVTVTVSPSTGLADGQIVAVTGSGFPAGTAGTVRECGGPAGAPQCDPATAAAFVTTAAGTIPPTAVALKRVVNAGATTFNCGVQACAVVATAGAKTAQHQIKMAGAGTVTTTASTTTSSTTSTVPPTSTSSTSTTRTTASTASPANSPTTAPAPPTGCADLRRTQSEANADLDALVAALPAYANVAAQVRAGTNARLAQSLAAAGC